MTATVNHRPPVEPTSGSDITPRKPPIAAAIFEARRMWVLVIARLSRIDRITLVRSAVIAGVCYAAMRAINLFGRPYVFLDLRIYHGAVQWWANGNELYSYADPLLGLGFTYPPFAAIAMLPMGLLPTIAAGWVNVIFGLAAVGLLLYWILQPLAQRLNWPRWYVVGLALPMAVATEPVRESLGFGQVNLILAVLIYADMIGLRRRFQHVADGRPLLPVGGGHPVRVLGRFIKRLWLTGALAGVGVGLATAIKLTPALFIVYFLVARQWRAAFTALITAVGVTLVTFLAAPNESSAYFTRIMWDTGRVGQVDATPNQSLAGVLARLYDSPTTPTLMWLAFAMVLLVLGLSRAMTAHREGDEVAAFTLIGLTANAICPISWSHHLVFIVPAIVILVDAASRRQASARGLAERGLQTRRFAGRGPLGFASLAGLRHWLGAAGVLALFVYSPIWPYEHKLSDGVSHYADGRWGALMENSLALAIIGLIAFLPWRTGAEPAFHDEPTLRAAMAQRRIPAQQVKGN